MIAKGGVLKAGEGAEQIRCRHREEVRQAKLQSVLKEKREKVRQSLKRKLDCMAELDNPHRLTPHLDRAASV